MTTKVVRQGGSPLLFIVLLDYLVRKVNRAVRGAIYRVTINANLF